MTSWAKMTPKERAIVTEKYRRLRQGNKGRKKPMPEEEAKPQLLDVVISTAYVEFSDVEPYANTMVYRFRISEDVWGTLLAAVKAEAVEGGQMSNAD